MDKHYSLLQKFVNYGRKRFYNIGPNVKRLARDKHYSLLQKFVNYGRKKFYNIGPRLKRLVRDKCFSLSGLFISEEERSSITVTTGIKVIKHFIFNLIDAV